MKTLKDYVRKRDFSRTREPAPAAGPVRRDRPPAFLIQKHDASRLHYDLRFAIGGVLKSWAVPKGLPLKKGEKRLAIQVEDHPLAYADFEGTIPKGQYGGGTVMLWDRGRVRFDGKSPRTGLARGHLDFELEGSKLRGAWTLVRFRAEENQWLLIKRGRDHPPMGKQEDVSAKSGRTMQAIVGKAKSGTKPARTKRRVGSTSPPERGRGRGTAKFIAPMLARPATELPRGSSWTYEVKFDGYRAVALIDARGGQLWSRNRNRLTRFAALEEALARLTLQPLVLDGEIVALEPGGRSSFQLLQRFEDGTEQPPLCYYVFDVMVAAGRDLRAEPLRERRRLLAKILPRGSGPIRLSRPLKGAPSAILAASRRHGFEGVIAKQADSPYESGQRTGEWRKLRFALEQEFVIGGFTAPGGSRSHFGALLLGYFEKGKLRYAGKVGTGFNSRSLADLHTKMNPLARASSPFVGDVPERSPTWLRPALVAQVRFAEWTREGHLRQPVFLGLRTDKDARAVKRET